MRFQLIRLIQYPFVVLLFLGSAVSYAQDNNAQGALFIIGGGSRPPEMVRELCQLALKDTTDYILIFPQASSEPDTSFYYATLQFRALGYHRIYQVFQEGDQPFRHTLLDTIRMASLIYLGGGDQSRFMELVKDNPLYMALHDAYNQGAVIAGTSAGAAVMSRLMITGDQKKYPDYTGDFQTIEAGNMELAQGLGLLSSVVIDQHFIKRMRFNRLLTVVLEQPEITGIGIDESTALYVKNSHGTVYGAGQVMVIRVQKDLVRSKQGLLGARDIRLDLLLKGDTLTF